MVLGYSRFRRCSVRHVITLAQFTNLVLLLLEYNYKQLTRKITYVKRKSAFQNYLK